ncbi:pyrroline-5-carboxylate reductase ProI [Ectobacillus polymachus]|uniref:pyrroline-5-carboxylate reductase ProI n=1 Tax=Ectobacillus polymachus TaxID=1508806 RepID=UPI003A8B4E44
MKIHKLAFVGSGSIAEAIIAGLIRTHYVEPEQIIVSNRSNKDRLTYFAETYGVNGTQDKMELLKEANVVCFAMKPKDVIGAIASIKPFIREDQLILSLVAGVDSSSITHLLGKNNPIVRVMPNTSAAILKSATAISPSKHATQEQLSLARELFETIGMVSIVDEEQMHAVTALSGSGPAYIYYVVEAMEKAAMQIGLSEEIATPLILQTLLGAADMLKTSAKHPSQLRKEITSPNGTTEAGVQVLESYNMQEAFIQCIVQATERSHELGEVLNETIEKL